MRRAWGFDQWCVPRVHLLLLGAELGHTVDMRQISEWTREDLQAFVDAGEPEGIHREYKASTVLHRDRKDELTKVVTAFANSDGGILIFGIVESNEKPPVPAGIDDGVGPEGMSRETLDQLLVSNISPPITGLIIREIELDEGHRTFAVQVPRGSPSDSASQTRHGCSGH